MEGEVRTQVSKQGAGLRILTGSVTSPTLYSQLQQILQRFPQAKWHQYDPDNGSTQLAGSLLAFGEPVWTRYRFESADIVLSLDSDFLTEGPAWLHYSRHWAERRQRRNGSGGMSRLYALESTPTCTGAVADNRLAVRASEIEDFARTVFRRVEMNVQKSPQPQTSDLRGLWADAVARDLLQHRGSSIVVPGTHQPAAVHALAHSLNHALGNTNKTVIHTAPVEPAPVDHIESLTELVGEMKQGKVDLLIILSFDPVFTAPADLEFAEALKRTVTSVYLGMYNDETAASASWHVPEAHFLESWGDVRAFDGSATIIQPLIMPLYGGRSPHEILALLQENPSATPYETVRRYWQSASQAKDFENFWTSALQTGVVPDTAFDSKDVTLQNRTPKAARREDAAGLEINFRIDPCVYDGRFSNNGWLQELPKPLTKLTWDNAALMSPATARSLGFDPNDVSRTGSQGLPVPLVELRYRGRSVQAPIFLLPGHPDNSVTAHLGYGLQRGGKHATGRGFNAYALRTSEAPWFYSGLEVRKLDSTAMLATTQRHFSLNGRNLMRVFDIQDLDTDPESETQQAGPMLHNSLYPSWPYHEYKWAMTVDLSRCIGCNSCVVACVAENNSPVVGKEQVGMAREMQWLRIDRYYSGKPDSPRTHFQPVYCMHCEKAPCELVCPVHATTHSSEGLNQMVYNRCVGTRYCSNNCPYKVRRFNFLQYSDYVTPSLKPLRNPDVTVRSRGVMEKCTYCVQRIQEAKINAAKENRPVKDGEIIMACQQACPTKVFTFGDLNDSNSMVSRAARNPLAYGMLAELNTVPRTRYLAGVRNPNPELG